MMFPNGNGPGRLTQVGIVVRDIHKSIETYKRLWGVESDEVVAYPSGCYVAHLYMPDITAQVELIAPTSMDSDWGAYLKEKGEGLHHLCFDVEDYEKACADFEKRGVKKLSANVNSQDNRVRYAVYDTSELGFVTELVNRAEVAKMDAAK